MKNTANCFGMKKVHRGLPIHQGPDDRFYAPWPDPLFEADTYEGLIGEVDALTNMQITARAMCGLSDDQRDAFLAGYGHGLRDGREPYQAS